MVLGSTNFVGEAFNGAERDFVSGMAGGGDFIPMALDIFGMFFAGLHSRPCRLASPGVRKTVVFRTRAGVPQLADMHRSDDR